MRVLNTGTTEYITVTVTSTTTLSAQPVAISFDRRNWITATWQGSSGTTRDCQALIQPANVPAVGTWPVFVRVTDSPEVPIIRAGVVSVQ